MPNNKTATLTVRIAPEFKEALRSAAETEHRSLSNMIEVLIRDHCRNHGISLQEDQKRNKDA